MGFLSTITGGLIGGSNAGKLNKANQAEMDRNTAVTAGQFDKTLAAQRASDEDIKNLGDEGFAQSLKLKNQDADENLKSSEWYGDSKNYAQRNAGDMVGDVARLRNYDTDVGNKRLGLDTLAEKTRQGVLQTGANSAVDDATNGIGFANTLKAADAAGATRGALIQNATAGTGFNPTTGGYTGEYVPDESSKFRTDLAAMLDKRIGTATKVAGANARVAGVGDAMAGNSRTLNNEATGLKTTGANSDLSKGALDREVSADQLVKDNAQHLADVRAEAVKANLGDFLSRLTTEHGSYDTARETENQSIADALESLYGGQIGAHQDYIQNRVGADNAATSNNTALSQFKIGSTSVTPSFGQLLLSAASNLGDAFISSKIK